MKYDVVGFDTTGVADVFSSTLPTNAIVLKPHLAPDGLIAVTNWFHAENDMTEMRALEPAIEMTGMSNGFVRYTPLNLWPTVDNGVWREMRDCPVTGYTNRLVIGSLENGKIYTFFRIGGFYGKGMFIVREVTDDRRECEVYFQSVIQSDGTRNVRTGSNWR
jgi:hypothetical protein